MRCDVFEDILHQIDNEQIQKFTVAVLNSVNEEFYKIPASITGKYHHEHSLGEGGLVRHVQRACYFGKLFIDSNKWDSNDVKGDIILSALLLHDIGKKGRYTTANGYIDHPITSMKMMETFKDLLPENHYKVIQGCVLYHMGPWSPNSVKKPMNKYNLLEMIVYQSDFLSSRKELDINLK